MSEELLQKKLNTRGIIVGNYEYYNIGNTNLNDLKIHHIVPSKDYKHYRLRKPDALLVDRRNKKEVNVILAIEWKSSEKLAKEQDKIIAIQQCNDVAQEIGAKIGLVTDGQNFIWFNPNHGIKFNEYKDKTTQKNRSYAFIKDEKGDNLNKPFVVDQKKNQTNINDLSPQTKKSIELINKILKFIGRQNSKLIKSPTVNPAGLATQIWQDIWSCSGATPEKALYTFLELFIFKYLSDLGILTKDEDSGAEVNFEYIYQLPKISAFKYYFNNARNYLRKKFPASPLDNTSIINGTVLNPGVIEHRLVFHKILTRFKKFGPLENIDPNFKSQIFEEFMKKSISQKNWGQYFTPRNIVDAIISISDIDNLPPNSKVCDPACGVGGFILEPIKVKEIENEDGLSFYYSMEGKKIKPRLKFFGYDKGFEKEEQLTIILAKANMLIFLSDLIKQNPNLTVVFSDLFNSTFTLFNKSILGSLSQIDKDYYDLILTNPPYVVPGSSNYKEAIKNDSKLKDFFKVNATGLEGLFSEWIIRSLKPEGKAFVIVPDGILNRLSDKKLRKFIQDECIIDGIISLPRNAFYTNSKKTYILAITKKGDKNKKQKAPIFAYIVSNIGETLDINRFPEPEKNNLPDMVNQFNEFKGSKHSFKTKSDRCKILPFECFDSAEHWVVDRFWTENELISLGIREEINSFTVDDCINLIQETENLIMKLKTDLLSLSQELEKDTKENNFISKPINKIFYIKKGESKYTKSYINSHKGKYDVYSSKTSEDGIIGKINSYDHDVECLTWTTDGTYVGTVYHRNTKFSMTTHCGALIPKTKKLYLPYFQAILNKTLNKYYVGEGSNKRITVYIIKDVSVPIPINSDGEFDIEKQKEIADRYIKLEEAKIKLQEEMKILSKVDIIFE